MTNTPAGRAEHSDPHAWSSGVNARTVALSAVVGAATVAWYALPDVVRSRGTRAALKTALLAGGTAAAVPLVASLGDTDPGAADPGDVDPAHTTGMTPAKVALVGGVLAAATAVTVWGERAIFRFGERRRTRGVRWAHTGPALVLGALAAVGALLDPPEPSANV